MLWFVLFDFVLVFVKFQYNYMYVITLRVDIIHPVFPSTSTSECWQCSIATGGVEKNTAGGISSQGHVDSSDVCAKYVLLFI